MQAVRNATLDAIGGDETRMRKQITRESHRRFILNQRLTVLERTNSELKTLIAALVKVDSINIPMASQPRLTSRSSSDGANIDWDMVVSNCMALAKYNAQMRTIIAKILSDKQLIDYRLQHLTKTDISEIELQARRIADERGLKRDVVNPDVSFLEMLGLSPRASPSAGWEVERTTSSGLAASAVVLETSRITRYLELSDWCESQRTWLGSAIETDQDLDRDMGFSQISESGFIYHYAFDEPDLASNICYQSTDGKENGVVTVRSGTITKIIKFMTSPGYLVDDKLERAFFVTLPSLSDSLTVLDLIIQRCIIPSPPNVTPAERRLFQTKFTAPVQTRCLALLQKWMDQFPSDFAADKSVSSLLEEHLIDLIETENWFSCQHEAKRLLHHFQEVVQPQQTCITRPLANEGQSAASISSFSQIDDNSFVQCICHEDGLAFGRIRPREFIKQAWSKPSGYAPNIHQAILRFNRMTSFVQNQILKETQLAKRTAVLARFIHLTENFRGKRNYNAMCGIFAGLNSNAIHRLKQTWDGLPRKTKSVFKTIKNLVSTNNNSRELRNEMKALRPPCVPHLGLTLKDLTFIDDGNPDRVSHGMINVNKMLMITETIDWVIECQRIPYTFDLELHPGVSDYLEKEFVIVNDETLWHLSQKIEPRKTG